MQRIIKTAARYPWLFLLGMALLTGLAMTQLDKLRVNISAESMLEKDTPAYAYFQQAEKIFGSDSITVIFLHDRELFTPQKLRLVREAAYAIDDLPFVARTASLVSTRNVKNVDGVIWTRPYLKEIPKTTEAAEALRAEALQNPLLLNNLISADGQTIAINVVTKPEPDNPEFDQVAAKAIEAILSKLEGKLDSVFQVGSSTVRNALTEKILSDQRLLLPMSLLVLLITLAVSLRRLSAAIIPLCTAGLSVLWTLGFMAWLGIPVNIMTSIVPALIIVIGSTEDIHLLAEYLLGIRLGQSRRSAIQFMADNMGLTVLLTFLTTYLGFLSISLNNIELLYQFGLIASTGLLFNFLITITLVPILLGVMGEQNQKVQPSKASARGVYQRLALAVLTLVRKHKWSSLSAIMVVALLALVGATRLSVNNNPMDFLEATSPIHHQAERVHQKLAGIHTFSIVVDSGIDGTFLQRKYLEELQEIQEQLAAMGVFDRSLSFADFIGFVNRVMDEEADPETPLPDSDGIVREYMLFIQHRDVGQYVSPDFDRARILVRHNIGASESLNQAVTQLRTFIAKEVDPALRVEVTGQSILSNQAVDAMSRGQFKSLLLVGAAVLIVVSLLFVNFRAGLVALLPNLFPIVVLFGVMGFTGIPLDAGTSMVAAIALGICVDDTMHAMARYHHQLKEHRHSAKALSAMVEAEAMPIFTTSVALAAGFGILATSSFLPVAHFGLLSAMVILLALLATFFITPLLLGSAELLTVWDLLSYQVRNEYLKQSPLFQGLNVWQIKKVLLTSEIRRFGAGEQILWEGAEGTEMFVVLEGGVEAVKTQDGGSVDHLRSIGIGEIFGEIAAFAGGKRTADVIAATNTAVLVLSWRRIDRLSKLFPFITFRVFRNLSHILGHKLAETHEYAIEPHHANLHDHDKAQRTKAGTSPHRQ